jgi:hypothetical protein
MHGDKKALAGLTLVLDGPRGVEPVTSVDLEAVRQALHSMEVR